jgi:comEA protein
MNIIKRINQTLGFTQNEGRIVMFLIGAFIVGCCAKMYLVSSHSMKRFDYSSSDSLFAARSNLLNSPESTSVKGAINFAVADSVKYPDPFDSTEEDGGKVQLNTATKQQLLTLPGVGDAIADLILSYREKHGRFKSLDDLTNVHGIGPKKIERLRPYVTLGD